MSDLISREASLEEIKDWQEDIHDNEYDANRYDFVFDRIYEILENTPTVDAVKVVRCKDCKHYGYILTCGCSRIETSEYGIATMKPDDFCSYGERKEVSE